MLISNLCGMTDVGKKRARNEDQFLVATLSKTLDVSHCSLELGKEMRLAGNSQGLLLLVADGMGGHAAGDRASAIVLGSFADYVLNMLRWYFRADSSREEALATDLRDAVLRCQGCIRDEVREHPEQRGMGATLTMAYVAWPQMFVAHVGDSRCYVYRNESLTQVTRDHTLAQLIADASDTAILRAASAIPESQRNDMIWNTVGGDSEELEPDVFRVDLQPHDRLLLCTDGLSKHVPDSRLSSRLKQNVPAAQICAGLIEDANAAGGTDNITAVVACIGNPDDTPS
jgi:serine/threonine protein phosphatase PrpC